MKIIPQFDQILLSENEVQQQTASGIILEQSTSKDTRTYTIEAIGEDVKGLTEKQKCFVKLEKVTPIKVHGKLYALAPADAVLAVVEE